MSDDKDGYITKVMGALGTLERASEIQTFMLLSTFAIAANIALTLTHQQNLAGFSWQYAKSNVPFGQVLIFLCVYTLYMSCGVGILRAVIDPIALKISRPVTKLFGDSPTQSNWRLTDHVTPMDLRITARTAEDDFYLTVLEAYEERKRERESGAWRTASLSFSLLALLLIELCLPSGSSLSAALVVFLDNILRHAGDAIAFVVITVLLILWLSQLHEADQSVDWVFCPRLYNKLQEQEAQLAEQRKREDEKRPSRFEA
ncbi:hypothetical protein PQQ52_20325 [Paraburkholderia sediminicola]|uniref:hypothetical protein n=1 Tax=Paraburkholderia sediminicola TaxID=458836 RepID=UPI0038BD9EA2